MRSRRSGGSNTGFANAGDLNTGSFNGGYLNTGDFNSGAFNSGSFNGGYPTRVSIIPERRTPAWVTRVTSIREAITLAI
ncbi:pentapeptide repeat-containing protein [Mycobacterium riyadhense]|uniref:pentapeptide repeat-containing protein n=1 Tax=Mycobacterium riyadhense TaxID=486698 RepID=UPI0025B2BD7A|nr:pentapeptide repeat-containing protein [Mycobacterium riyadhense]